jgi:hypothetical protein
MAVSNNQIKVIHDIIEIIGGYRYGGNSFEIFDRVFGSTNPFTEKMEEDGRD